MGIHGSKALELVNLLKKDVSRRWTLADLALALNRSPRSIQRDIGALGQTFGGLVRAIRVEHAAHLLATTNLQLDEIANRCGFCDQPHFQRDFKSIVALTPRQYRIMASKSSA